MEFFFNAIVVTRPNIKAGAGATAPISASITVLTCCFVYLRMLRMDESVLEGVV